MSDLETLLQASIEVAKLKAENHLLREENDRIRAQIEAIKDISTRLRGQISDTLEQLQR